MNQPTDYEQVLNSFLNANDLKWISWIHSFRMDDYLTASKTLWSIASSEKTLKSQQIAVSLSKLAFINSQDPQKILDPSNHLRIMT
jgi:hypothetical protein